jgi:uncharacterized coiled-coil protein SlyX
MANEMVNEDAPVLIGYHPLLTWSGSIRPWRMAHHENETIQRLLVEGHKCVLILYAPLPGTPFYEWCGQTKCEMDSPFHKAIPHPSNYLEMERRINCLEVNQSCTNRQFAMLQQVIANMEFVVRSHLDMLRYLKQEISDTQEDLYVINSAKNNKKRRDTSAKMQMICAPPVTINAKEAATTLLSMVKPQ